MLNKFNREYIKTIPYDKTAKSAIVAYKDVLRKIEDEFKSTKGGIGLDELTPNMEIAALCLVVSDGSEFVSTLIGAAIHHDKNYNIKIITDTEALQYVIHHATLEVYDTLVILGMKDLAATWNEYVDESNKAQMQAMAKDAGLDKYKDEVIKDEIIKTIAAINRVVERAKNKNSEESPSMDTRPSEKHHASDIAKGFFDLFK